MRGRLTLLVAATTGAVVLAFVIPLALLVRTLAADRAVVNATQEAQNVAVLITAVRDPAELRSLVARLDARSSRAITVELPDGTRLGTPVAGPAAQVRRARQGEAFTVRAGGAASVYVPVVLSSGTAVVRSTVTATEQTGGTATATWTVVGLGVLLLASSVAAADRLARIVSRPITDLAATAHDLRAGNLDARVAPSGPPEVAALGHALNRLAARIGELLVAERESVADLSHRLRTPVTALRLDADAVRDPVVSGRLRQHVEDLERTVSTVVAEARRPLRREVDAACDVAAVVTERVGFWSALAQDQHRAVNLDAPDGPVQAGVHANDLAEALDTLLDNVFAHTPEGTALAVRVHRQPGGQVRVDVDDAGPGLPEGSLVRGQSGAGSSGLGLDIARRVAEHSGGRLDVGRSDLGGARLSLHLGAVGP